MFTGRIIPKSVEQGGGENRDKGEVKMVQGVRYNGQGVHVLWPGGIGIIDREDRYNVHGVGIMSRRQNFLSSKFCLFCLARG